MEGNTQLAKRFARFGLVGASGTAVNLSLFWLFTSLCHVHYLVAGPLAFELSFLSNYALHNAWTFGDRRARFLSASLMRCQLVSAGGLLISTATLYLLVNELGTPSLLANVAGIALATGWNFCLSTRWTWRTPSAAAAPA